MKASKISCGAVLASAVLVGALPAARAAVLLTWEPLSGGAIGTNPVGGGREGDTSTYVCHVALANGSTVVGKIVPFEGVCKISWNGTESSYSSYAGLQLRQGNVAWVRRDPFSVVPNAVPGGVEWNPFNNGGAGGWSTTFICLAYHEGNWVIGRYLHWYRACNYGLGGTEYTVQDFSVLVTTP